MFRINQKNIFFVLMGTVLLLSGCGSDRVGEIAEKQVAGVIERDSDGDGINDNDERNIYFTDPFNTDSDDDGLLDGDEINNYETNATEPDTDGDGLKDGEEVKIYETSPTNTDSDNDGLKDGVETKEYETNPNNRDSDGDGISDGDEIKRYLTNPLLADSDGDGLNDGEEINTYGTSPLNIDSDNDGLKDGEEVSDYETSPSNSDTDGDGLKDGEEARYLTNPLIADSDNDGLKDGEEVNTYGTNPANADSDSDGLKDGEEVKTYVINPSNPLNPDTDGDGLNDGEEVNTYGTNPANDDSDSDGLKDGDEVNIHHTHPKNSDSDSDGLSDGQEVNSYGTNPTDTDTDRDGLSDGNELNIYHTDPKKRDSDDDGLEDADEIRLGSNPNNGDSDGDSLKDGDEINTYETNATNPDTDGDCLFDNHEVLNYGTDPKKSDSDGDGVEDGFEIYGDLNATCVVRNVFHTTPAQDNMPIDGDVIDALDPTNDSDGDGWANLQELNCTGGDPKDISETCPTINSTPEGEALASYGYTFIPGAFDVDGDGLNEGGFWAATYQATAIGTKILNTEVKSTIGSNFNAFVADNFSLLNSNSQIEGFFEGEFPLNDDAEQLTFKEGDILEATTRVRKSSMPRYVGMSPYMAMVSIKHVKFKDTDSNDLGVDIDMLSNKQYTHIQMLLDKDKEVNGENNDSYVPIVRNGLLGVDIHVPIMNYEIEMEEFGKDYLEFVSDALHMYSADGVVFNEATDIESWWGIEEKDFPSTGTNSRDELRDIDGDGIIEGIVSGDGGYYAIMARGGSLLNLKEGVIGGKKIATGDGIGFRAATSYLY